MPGSQDIRRIHFISLGCPKNRVDTEVMVGKALGAGYQLEDDPAESDVIVVNTCGFLQASAEESIDTILDMAAYKQSGRLKTLVMAGCLVQRHADELAAELPEVDHFIGTGEFHRLTDLLATSGSRLAVDTPIYVLDHRTPRTITTAHHAVYLKISEGCDNKCAFCIIPTLRGAQRSRPVNDLVAEAKALTAAGAKEITLIAQDLTAYGYDQEPRTDLADLLDGLSGVNGLRWIRLLYAYPRRFPGRMLDLMRERENIVPYLDMPLQHINDEMLRAMRRGRDSAFIRLLLDTIREKVPGITLRTTFIVGFPGETDAQFEELVKFVEEYQFERMGVFGYSQEPGTPAGEMPGQLPAEVIEERRKHLMGVQRKISRRQQRKMLGQVIDVLVEGPSDETEHLLVGRDKSRAPEIDGLVYINDGAPAIGDIVKVKITEAGDYDLVGHVVPG
ncbi:MAG: Ribosomal protein S12 methylthiotransferase RimO [Myxococcota bacterium]|nr:Ribosomal protein S12 methylthiotransferase RimO [Myxococcota bacterium]